MEKVDEWVLALSSDNGGEIGLYRVYATKTDMKNLRITPRILPYLYGR